MGVHPISPLLMRGKNGVNLLTLTSANNGVYYRCIHYGGKVWYERKFI